MNRLPYFLTLVVLIAAAFVGWGAWLSQVQHVGSEAVPIPPAEEAKRPKLTEFSLQERSGRTFHSNEMEGRIWVASFFFTTCPGSCLRLNQAIKLLHDDKSLTDVYFVSITCDPDNDTLGALAEYASRFGADPQRWLFCRGELDYVQRIAQDMMQLSVMRQTHSDRAIVFDRGGKVRGRFLLTDPNQVNMLNRLLAQLHQEG
jgi:cytochrome oxidase Cu insertion factor (SCO1/SenC/PrrC family)